MSKAADEIEFLRSRTGAVTPGPSLADLKSAQAAQCAVAAKPA